jgi:hypothetical protein
MANFWSWMPVGTVNDFNYGSHIGKWAAGTINDFIHGHQGALWMTSSMDATEGGEQSDLKPDNNRNHGDVLLDC